MKKMIPWVLSLFCIHAIIPITHAYSQGQSTLIEIHPSDSTAFTQGFELAGDKLIIGTGLYGESAIGVLDLDTGKIEVKDSLDKRYFGEGITVTPEAIWQLTWKEGIAFKRDLDNFEIIDQVNYEGEGWGIAYSQDQDILYMTDGTSRMQLRDAQTFVLEDIITVTYQGKPLEQINEIEYAEGYLWANIWYTNVIVKIAPQTGEVVEFYDLSAILKETLTEQQQQTVDVLNGIAHIEGSRFYVTGKLYPIVLEIVLE